MKSQSITTQILIGGGFGFLMAFINRLNGSNIEPLMSLYGIGMLIGGAVSGAILYVLLYRSWPRNK
jgi:Na+/H+ antiporter NhaA